jgi:hypothetical protein
MKPGEIAKLVKSLRRNCTHVTCGCDYHRAADALEHLSAPVLPEEVAEMCRHRAARDAELEAVRKALTERGVSWEDRAKRALAKLDAKEG